MVEKPFAVSKLFIAIETNYIFNTTKVIKLPTLYKKAPTISRHLLRLYYYLRTKVKLSPRAIAELMYLDIGYSVTLVNRMFLKAQVPHYQILRQELLLIVRRISSNQHSIIKYIKLNIYISKRYNSNKRSIEALLRY